jgi:hypothetical protein
MKLLDSTRHLLNYQFWCKHLELLLQIVSEHQSHRWPDQFRRASEQANEAAAFAGQWKIQWINSHA